MPTFQLPDPERTILAQEDLTLRPLRPADMDALWAAGQAEDIGRYTSIEWPFTRDAAARLIADARRAWAAGSAARFALLAGAGADALLAGTISLLHIYPECADAEVGYWLAPAARGRGLARRALSLVSDWAGASLPLQRLHLMVDLDNPASQAVAEGAGYVYIHDEPWRHPSDPSKDALVHVYERRIAR